MLTRISRPLLLAALLGAAQAVAAPPETLLRIGGANTDDTRLSAELARGYLQRRGAEQIKVFDRSRQLRITAQLEGSTVQVTIDRTDMAAAEHQLQSGELDLVLSSQRIARPGRDPAAAERKLPAENVIALQALALAVNPRNPLRAIDEQQLRQLLRAGVSNWQQLGGADQPVELMADERLPGELLQQWLGQERPIRLQDPEALAQTLERNPGGLALIPAVSAERYRTLAIDAGQTPLAPQTALIASEDYPLARRLYLYGGGSDATQADSFVDFALSDAGQALIEDNGLIGLTPRTVKVSPRGDLPEAYKKLIDEAQRLSISFRFENGGTELDARAQRDIARLQDYLQQPEQKNKRIALVSFSDSQRRESMARTISRFRAVRVQQALRQLDMAAERLLPLGSSAPLTLDESLAEQRNARVEVWLF